MKAPQEKGMKRRSYIVAAAGSAAFAICVLAGGLWFFRMGKDRPVAIKPTGEYPAGQVVSYCQKDEAWKEDALGSSACRMGGSGCLTTCIASALSTQGAVSETGFSITPGELNQIFGEGNVYNSQGDIVWKKVEEALPQVQVVVASAIDGEEIENLLALGYYPMVKVRVGGLGAFHWVLLVGSSQGEYLCMDPLEPEGKLVPLSRHGGAVYRMRCVY